MFGLGAQEIWAIVALVGLFFGPSAVLKWIEMFKKVKSASTETIENKQDA